MSKEYAIQQLNRDKVIANSVIEHYKGNLISNLPPKEEFVVESTPKPEAKKNKKTIFTKFFSIFS